MKLAVGTFKAQQRFYIKIFYIGVIIGMITLNFGKSILLENTGLFDEYTLYHMKNMTVDSDALFVFILGERTKVMLFLVIAATTYLGLFACRGIFLWYGFSAGAFISILIMRYGIKGIFLAVVSIFPQYFLYIPAMLALVLWCEGVFRGIYYKNGEFSGDDRKGNATKIGQLLIILVMILLGCFLEGYVNSKLLLGYLQVF